MPTPKSKPSTTSPVDLETRYQQAKTALAERYTVLTFTSLHPETLPAGTGHAISSRNLHSFSIGECYGRTDTYPTGVYWVVLTLE